MKVILTTLLLLSTPAMAEPVDAESAILIRAMSLCHRVYPSATLADCFSMVHASLNCEEKLDGSDCARLSVDDMVKRMMKRLQEAETTQ